MKTSVLESFLLGVTLGIGATVLSLYTQKPGFFVASIEAMAEKGRMRRAKRAESEFWRQRLKEVGFSDEEVEDISQ